MLEILLSTQAWALHTSYFNTVAPIILARLEKGLPVADLLDPLADRGDNLRANEEAKRRAEFSRTFSASFQSAAAEGSPMQTVNVQVIKLQGPMTKNGGMCTYGTRQVAEQIKAANKNADIGAIVLHTDSPGGAVDGTEELARTIAESKKPIVAWVDGLAASAAYWAASQTDHIMMSSDTTAWVGSIGTLIQHVDKSAWLTKEGYKVTMITADASVDKTLGNSFEPLTPAAEANFKKSLNKINDRFISDVKAGRGKKLKAGNEVFTGQVYHGDEAMSHGLADSVGSLNDAITKAAQLAVSPSKNSNSNSKKADMKKTPFLAGLFNRNVEQPSETASAVDTHVEAEVTEAQLLQAEQTLEQLHASVAEKDATITAQAGTIESLTAQVAERDGQITALQAADAEKTAQIAALTAQLAGQSQELATLEEWRENARAKDGRQEDELNKLNAPKVELSPNQQAAQAYLEENKKIKAKKGIKA